MKQFIDGSLKTKRSKMYYKNEPVDNYDYEDQPHEIAAREQRKLYTKNIMKKDWKVYCEKTFNNLKQTHINGDHRLTGIGLPSHEITTLVSLIVEIQIQLE